MWMNYLTGKITSQRESQITCLIKWQINSTVCKNCIKILLSAFKININNINSSFILLVLNQNYDDNYWYSYWCLIL